MSLCENQQQHQQQKRTTGTKTHLVQPPSYPSARPCCCCTAVASFYLYFCRLEPRTTLYDTIATQQYQSKHICMLYGIYHTCVQRGDNISRGKRKNLNRARTCWRSAVGRTLLLLLMLMLLLMLLLTLHWCCDENKEQSQLGIPLCTQYACLPVCEAPQKNAEYKCCCNIPSYIPSKVVNDA